jgi:ComF family protein
MRRTVASPRSPALGRLLDAAVHFVLPAWCFGCGAALPWRPSPLGLCAACRRALPAAPASDVLHAAWSYQPPIDEVIRRLKYGRLEYLAEDLASGIAEAVLASGTPRHDWVTPVPLHWRRRLDRGYDQAALLAAGVARRLDVPFRTFLVRTRATPPQAGAPASSRRDNVVGAFACPARRRPGLQGARVLLVDDVVTTGATLDAASRALLGAGAAEIAAAVAAATPPPASRRPTRSS